MHILLFVLLLGIASADPQIIGLSRQSVANSPNNVNVEVGGNLYLASNDDSAQLQKITITTGTTTLSLDQLSDGKSLKILSNQLTIQSNLLDATATKLTGYLYVTTAIQANDNTFDVKVVNGPQALNQNGDSTTTVILNTQYKDDFPSYFAPEKTTYVTEVQQFRSNPINFHYGIPGDNWKTFTDNQFFENPQPFDFFDDHGRPHTNMIFFDSVEPMQINLPYWYITAGGPFSLNMDSTFNDEPIHNTTSANTTGVYILNDVWRNPIVNFATDPTRKGYSGVLAYVDLDYSACIIFNNVIKGDANYTMCFGADNKIVHGQLSSNLVSKSLVVNATSGNPGTLYFQYFVFTGELYPITSSTQPPPSTTVTTTTAIATTTGSAGNHDAFFLILFASLFAKYLL
ncbi:unnamed protein product [Caenorhabditis nigoni]